MLKTLLVLSLLAVGSPAPLAPSSSLTIAVDGAAPVVLTAAALQSLPHVAVTWRDRAGEHHGEGAALEALLAHAGFVALPSSSPASPPVAPAQKHRALRSVVLVTARDGYTAVFSAAELTASVGATQAVVVWSESNAAIGDDVGPLRLVVPTDKAAARAVRQLSTITVRAVEP